MKYCPNCQRINIGRPQICNYCGRSWYVRLCPSRHENPYDVQYCGTCGSTDLTDTAGAKPWWSTILRVIIWILFILFIFNLSRNANQLFPLILILSFPVIMLSAVYFLIGSLAPWPLNKFLRYVNGKLKMLVSSFLVMLWNAIRKILFNG
jgi:hypothetical protein